MRYDEIECEIEEQANKLIEDFKVPRRALLGRKQWKAFHDFYLSSRVTIKGSQVGTAITSLMTTGGVIEIVPADDEFLVKVET